MYTNQSLTFNEVDLGRNKSCKVLASCALARKWIDFHNVLYYVCLSFMIVFEYVQNNEYPEFLSGVQRKQKFFFYYYISRLGIENFIFVYYKDVC